LKNDLAELRDDCFLEISVHCSARKNIGVRGTKKISDKQEKTSDKQRKWAEIEPLIKKTRTPAIVAVLGP